jgi:hypothetical protein
VVGSAICGAQIATGEAARSARHIRTGHHLIARGIDVERAKVDASRIVPALFRFGPERTIGFRLLSGKQVRMLAALGSE